MELLELLDELLDELPKPEESRSSVSSLLRRGGLNGASTAGECADSHTALTKTPTITAGRPANIKKASGGQTYNMAGT
jgi:hypothetical protein